MDYNKELQLPLSPDFKLGEYIYMGMGKVNDKTVCISVAYKIDYCKRKAEEFVSLVPSVKFSHINKVKVGEIEAMDKLYITK